MSGLGRSAYLAFLTVFFVSAAASPNFAQCLATFKELNIAGGGTDYHGRPVINPQDAVGLNYAACLQHCGPGQESFNWTTFSQQFSAWLLPWLALVSQLPFGSESRLDNLISVILTVGSPTLAAFSLVLTAVNIRWVNDRFSAIKYPNHKNAIKALIYLQQVPLHLTTRSGLLASLIVLPENDNWWECLIDRLEQAHTWTIAAATSIAWIIIAFVLAIVDSFINMESLNSNGQGVGSLWLWLVSIIVGWLWIPPNSYEKLKTAIDKANHLAFVAAPDFILQTDGVGDSPNTNGSCNNHPPRRAIHVSRIQAVRMSERTEVFTRDAARTAPVFDYARIWEWWCIVEMIAQAFEYADKNAENHIPVDSSKGWVLSVDRDIAVHHDNRTGTIDQVQAYCGFPVQGEEEPVRPVPPGVWKRILIASVFTLGLQWGTTGSAAMIMILTPTTGLGCRSSSFLLYGIVSTTIWSTLLLSSKLAHYAKVRHDYGIPRSGLNTITVAEGLATLLRRLSILLAGCNTLWIILVCLFEFSSLYNTCYCDSSVLGRGVQRAYNLIIATGYDYHSTRVAWTGGFVFAGGCAGLYLFFLSLMLERPHDTGHR